MVKRFTALRYKMREVFKPFIEEYNGHSGPIKVIVNIGSVLPPQHKGKISQYSRDKLHEMQTKFDELESGGVFVHLEDVSVVVEYLNPSFLVKKKNEGFRLVTAFNEVRQYGKSQPLLMPDVNHILRMIG